MHGVFEQFPVREENGISLRKIVREDAEDLQDLYACPLKLESIRRMIADYDRCYEEKKEILIGFAVEKQIYGVLELYHFEKDSCELGYRTCMHGRRQGMTARAVGLLMEALKDTGIAKVQARCEKENRASVRILEENGFHLMKKEDQKYLYQRNLREE